MLLILQIAAKSFQTSLLNSLSEVLTKLPLRFFKNLNFNDFFLYFSLTCDPLELKFSKHYSYKLQPKSLQTCPKFSTQRSSQNYFVNFWYFEFTIFFSPKFEFMIESNGVIVERNGVKLGLAGSCSTYMWFIFGLVAFNVILGNDFYEYTIFKMLLLLLILYLFTAFPFDSPHKSCFLEFWNLNLKKWQ